MALQLKTDASLLEIVRNHFSSICVSMCYAIERTSYTTYVNESGDFTAVLVTPDGKQFMYPRTAGVTSFLGLDLPKAIEEAGGNESMREGDLLITNDPYSTNGLSSHLTDISTFKPVFWDGQLVCYIWSFIHSSDVGGSVPSSLRPDATDIQMEGLRIPPVRLYREGALDADIRRLILAASRQPDLLLGDINCMVSAMATGEARMHECIGKFGVQTVVDAQADLIAISQERAQAIIQRIPDGTYSFEDYLDDDAESQVPIRIAVDLTVSGGDLTLDFSRSDPQVGTAFNLVTGGSDHPYMYQGLINFIISEDPFIPINAGLTLPIHTVAPEGTVMNAQYPAAVGLRHPLSMRLFSACLGALAQVIPAHIAAAGGGQAEIVTLSEPDEAAGGVMRAIVVEPLGGGDGAQSFVDGIDGIDHSTGFLRNTPIETIENRTRVLVKRYEYVPDTGGAGKYRGGCALRLDFQPLVERSLVGARGQEHLRFQPWGLAGGRAGQLGHSILNPDTPGETELGKISMQPLSEGDVISFRAPSGGGWGNPFERDPNLVLGDVNNQLVSVEHARADYGVAVVEANGKLSVDAEETRRLRAEAGKRADHAPSVYDLGEARGAYESVWTAQASDRLAQLAQDIPVNRRSLRKIQVHQHLQGATQPLSAEDVERTWNQLESPEPSQADSAAADESDAVRAILDKVDLAGAITPEQYAQAVKGAIQARSKVTYLIWKELKKVMPEDEATALIGRAYRAFGKQAGETWEGVADAASALRAQSSKGGFLVFQQTLKCADAEYAQKDFAFCPHIEAFRQMGATDDEIKTLCQDILSEGDYGNLDAHDGITLEFKKQIGAGDDHCEYCLSCPARS